MLDTRSASGLQALELTGWGIGDGRGGVDGFITLFESGGLVLDLPSCADSLLLLKVVAITDSHPAVLTAVLTAVLALLAFQEVVRINWPSQCHFLPGFILAWHWYAMAATRGRPRHGGQAVHYLRQYQCYMLLSILRACRLVRPASRHAGVSPAKEHTQGAAEFLHQQK